MAWHGKHMNLHALIRRPLQLRKSNGCGFFFPVLHQACKVFSAAGATNLDLHSSIQAFASTAFGSFLGAPPWLPLLETFCPLLGVSEPLLGVFGLLTAEADLHSSIQILASLAFGSFSGPGPAPWLPLLEASALASEPEDGWGLLPFELAEDLLACDPALQLSIHCLASFALAWACPRIMLSQCEQRVSKAFKTSFLGSAPRCHHGLLGLLKSNSAIVCMKNLLIPWKQSLVMSLSSSNFCQVKDRVWAECCWMNVSMDDGFAIAFSMPFSCPTCWRDGQACPHLIALIYKICHCWSSRCHQGD